jgi:hypothetical protein
MDKQFWLDIPSADFAVPRGHSVAELTPELFDLLGSPDAELRDEVAYYTLSAWIERGHYSPEALRAMAERMAANLRVGIGERESDSALLRSFSVLVLSEVLAYDGRLSFLDDAEARSLLDNVLVYLAAEQDLRGYDPRLGWVHACAHTADALAQFAQHRSVTVEQLLRILEGIGAKMKAPTDHVYLDGEDERMVTAVLALMRRGLVPVPALGAWADGVAKPAHRDWTTAFVDPRENIARHNARGFLRSLYLRLAVGPDRPSTADALLPRLVSTLRALGPIH